VSVCVCVCVCVCVINTLSAQKREGRAGVEPATYRAAIDCSTTELTPHNISTIDVLADNKKKWWRSRVSIPVPPACKAGALPLELHPQLVLHVWTQSNTDQPCLKIKHNSASFPSLPCERKAEDIPKGMRQPGVEPGAKAWEASMLPIHHWRKHTKGSKCTHTHVTAPIKSNQKMVWRSRVSIPVPADCEPTALPSELHPRLYAIVRPFQKGGTGCCTSYGVRTHASCETGA
jgi:hypothetical protein